MTRGVPLERVADVYLYACAAGRPPIGEVSELFGAPRSTVTQWVSQARRAGLIPPAAGRGRSPKRNARAVAVADALGVSYEQLVDAVRRHADGDLRIGGEK